MLVATEVMQRLRGLWPNSKNLSVAICAEIVNHCNAQGASAASFERALREYRAHDERFSPTWNRLKPFLPRPIESRIIMGIPNWMHDETQKANELWAASRHTEYCRLGIACAAGIPGGYTLGRWEEMLEWAIKEDAAIAAHKKQHQQEAAASKLRLNAAYERMLAHAQRREVTG